MSGSSLRRLGFPIVIAALLPGSAWAQDVPSAAGTVAAATPASIDLQHLTREGDTIEVADISGRHVRGKVLDLSSASLTLAVGGEQDRGPAQRVIPAAAVDRIARVDSLLNGTLIGLGAGLAAGIAPGAALASYCENEAGGDCTPWFLTTDLVIGGVGAAIGAGIDGLKKEVIYSSRPIGRTALPRPAESFAELGSVVRTGQTVSLTNASGVEITGRIARLSPHSLELTLPGGRVEFADGQVRQMQRFGDPLWNGALIGAGAGFGMGLLSMARCNAGLVCGAAAAPVVAVETGIGTGIGLAIDALHKGRKLVYLNRSLLEMQSPSTQRSVTVSPVLARARQGVMVSVRF